MADDRGADDFEDAGDDAGATDDDFAAFEAQFADDALVDLGDGRFDDDVDDRDAADVDDDDDGFDDDDGGFVDDDEGYERVAPAVQLHPAVLASNWRTVLAVDAACGFGVLVVGLVLMVVWNLYAGAFVASAALVYVLLVGRRALQWRWLRRQAGI